MITLSNGARIVKRIGNDIAFSVYVKNAEGQGEDFEGKNPTFYLISPRKERKALTGTLETKNGAYTGRVFFLWKASEQTYIGEYQFVFSEEYNEGSGYTFDKKAFITLYASNDDFANTLSEDELEIVIENETTASVMARNAAAEAISAANAINDLSFTLDMATGKLYYSLGPSSSGEGGDDIYEIGVSKTSLSLGINESGDVELHTTAPFTITIE